MIKKEYDFSKAERGKFYHPDVELNIPIYLEPDLAEVVRERANKQDVDMTTIVNDWLRKDIRSEGQARRLRNQ